MLNHAQRNNKKLQRNGLGRQKISRNKETSTFLAHFLGGVAFYTVKR